MRINVLESVAGPDFSYSVGVHDVPDDLAKQMLRAKMGAEVPAEQEDFPEVAAVEAPERAVKPRGRPKRTVGK